MSAYTNLVRAINRSQYLIEQENQESNIKINKLVNSPEMEELLNRKIVSFLETTQGRILKAMGFNLKYIRSIMLPIIKDIGPEAAEIYKNL